MEQDVIIPERVSGGKMIFETMERKKCIVSHKYLIAKGTMGSMQGLWRDL